eukprot:m.63128 g.63128  ORF g.63128 m.63128 type:complete len:163 (+) comp13425_c0_seq2:175-663(+)
MAAPASLSEELCAQVEAFMQETKEEHAIILACDKKTRSVTFKGEVEDATPEDIAEELTSLPRFIFYKHKVSVDERHSQVTLLNIFFNPMDAPADLKRMYLDTRPVLLDKFAHLRKYGREVEVTQEEDLNEVWLGVKARGLTGRMAPPLPGQYSTFAGAENRL